MSGKRHLRRLGLIAAVLLVSAHVAAADEPSAAEKRKAKKLLTAAEQAKGKGDKLAAKGKDEQARTQWRSAALAYLEAYSLVEAPVILFKLSEVYLARGEKLWAVAGYRTYLARDPEGSGADRAREKSAELEKEWLADRKAGTEWGPGDSELDPTAVFDPVKPPEIEKPKPKPAPKPKPKPKPRPVKVEPTGPPAEHPGRMMIWSGYGAGGLGVILLAIGIKYGADASAASNDLSSKTGAWDLNDRRRIEAGQAAEKKQIIFTLTGVAAIGAGGVLWWLGERREARARARRRAEVSVLPGPDGALLTVGGRF